MKFLNKTQGILVRLFCAFCTGGTLASLFLEPSGAGSFGAWAVILIVAAIGWHIGGKAAENL